jgi:hypothetical protein
LSSPRVRNFLAYSLDVTDAIKSSLPIQNEYFRLLLVLFGRDADLLQALYLQVTTQNNTDCATIRDFYKYNINAGNFFAYICYFMSYYERDWSQVEIKATEMAGTGIRGKKIKLIFHKPRKK